MVRFVMQCLQDGLVDLEKRLRSDGKIETAEFFSSLMDELQTGSKKELRKALDRLLGSAAITQYAAFTNEQEALYLRILKDAQEIRRA